MLLGEYDHGHCMVAYIAYAVAMVVAEHRPLAALTAVILH